MKDTFVLCLDLEGGVFDLFNLISYAATFIGTLPNNNYFGWERA
jgi:hypothetical protein